MKDDGFLSSFDRCTVDHFCEFEYVMRLERFRTQSLKVGDRGIRRGMIFPLAESRPVISIEY